MSSHSEPDHNEETNSAATPKPSRAWKILKRSLLTLIFIFVTVCIFVSWALGTQHGRQWTLVNAVDYINGLDTGITIEIDGVSSPGLADWYFESLTVSKNNAPLVQAKKLRLQAQLSPLLSKRIIVDEISSATLSYYHQAPNSADVPPQEKPATGLPAFDWQIELKKLAIDELALSLPQVDYLPSYSINGKASAFTPTSPLDVAFTAHSVGTAQPAMSLDIRSNLIDNNTLAINAKIQEATSAEQQGLLGTLIKLPANQAVDAQLDATVYFDEQSITLDLNQFSQPLNSYALAANGKILSNKTFTDITLQAFTLHTNKKQHTFDVHWDNTQAQAKVAGAVAFDAFPLDILSPWVPAIQGGFLTSDTTFNTQLPSEIKQAQEPLDIQPLLSSIITPSLVLNSNSSLAISLVQHEETLPLEAQLNIDIANQNAAIKTLWLHTKSTDQNIDLKAKGDINVAKSTLALSLNINAISAKTLREVLHKANQPLPHDLTLNIDKTIATLNGSYLNQFTDLKIDVSTGVHGTYRQQPLSASVSAKGTSKLISLTSTKAALGETMLSADGNLDLFGDKTAITAHVKNISAPFLKLFNIDLPHELEGNIQVVAKVDGKLTAPAADIKMDGELSYPLLQLNGRHERQPIALDLAANWRNNNLSVGLFSLQLPNAPTSAPLLNLKGDINLTTPLPAMNWSVQANQLPAALVAPYGWPDSKGHLTIKLDATTPAAQAFDFNWLANLHFNGEGHYLTQFKQRTSRKKNGSQLKLQNIDWQFTFTDKDTTQTDNANDASDKSGNWKLQSNIIRTQVENNETEKKNATAEEPATNSQTDWINVSVNKQSLFDSLKGSSQLPNITLSSRLNLGALAFLLERDHKLDGLFNAELALKGSRTNPHISGQLNLAEGVYQNSSQGLNFKNITLDAVADGPNLALSNINIEDTRGGSVTAQGSLNWLEPFAKDAVQLTIQANSMAAIDRKEIEGEINGELNLTGNFDELLLSGELEVAPLSVSIEGNPGPSIPQIDYSFASEEIEETAASESNIPVLSLDLTIRADQQAFIRGRGLEAELAGKIDLSGPVTNIAYHGAFKTVRGHFDIFGNRFKLERGEVGFSNEVATILISGLTRKKDTEIRAEVTGIGDKFTLKLSSVPALPEEEILAQLIFGKNRQEITAIQAVQLASAVNTLKGGGGGFDPIGSTRELLGVDTLTVDSDENEAGDKGVKVGAGKYLSEDVYLEVERSSDPIHPWQGNILIELTPSISLESTTGGAKGGSAELLWKRDY